MIQSLLLLLLYRITCLLLIISVSALGPPDLPNRLESTRRSFLAEQGAMMTMLLQVQVPPVATMAVTAGWLLMSPASASAMAETGSTTALSELLAQMKQAQSQLDKIPALIENEKWDSVRAILITPPLSDCWAKTNRPLVSKYAETLGNAGGDELAALEAREELVSHLRYLDMSVYNNVFNPIKVEGKSGATKELIRSYYEDPINEFKASKTALQELIGLSKDFLAES